MRPLEEMGKYATVVIDPPWPVSHRIHSGLLLPNNRGMGCSNIGLPYATMSLKEIAALPMPSILSDDSRVFCWTVHRFLPDTFRLLECWGLDYTFTLTWMKNKGLQLPQSPYFNSEFCVVGRCGHPQWETVKSFQTAHYWPIQAHSEKPEGFYDLLRRVTPGPRLDIFGRRRIAGFDSWGNEAPEGRALPDHYQEVML